MRLVELPDGGLRLNLSYADTYDWAHKPDSAWPCSQLSGMRLFAEFAKNGDLVDFTINGKQGDMDCNEFDAITSDFIRTKFPDHPAVKS